MPKHTMTIIESEHCPNDSTWHLPLRIGDQVCAGSMEDTGLRCQKCCGKRMAGAMIILVRTS
jgi:hypothetical protein